MSSCVASPAPSPLAAPAPPKTIVQLLREEGKLTEEQLQRALIRQRETGAFIGDVLVQEELVNEQSLLSFLSKHCRVPHLSLLDYLIDKKMVTLLPEAVCRKYRLFTDRQNGLESDRGHGQSPRHGGVGTRQILMSESADQAHSVFEPAFSDCR